MTINLGGISSGTAAVGGAATEITTGAILADAVPPLALLGVLGYAEYQRGQIDDLVNDIRNLRAMAAKMERKLNEKLDEREVKKGHIHDLKDGEWVDEDGNVRDRSGRIVKDNLGNEFDENGFLKCKKGKKDNDPLRKHHSWPKYLGGAEEQDLVPLPKSLHDAFHSGWIKYCHVKEGLTIMILFRGRRASKPFAICQIIQRHLTRSTVLACMMQ